MKTNTSFKIIEYLKKNGHTAAKDLVDYLEISRQAVFKQLARLVKDGKICKIGKPPKVFYYINDQKQPTVDVATLLDEADQKIIERSFFIITPAGERKSGIEGFSFWCQKTNQPIQKTAKEYVRTLAKYNAFKKDGLIDGTQKLLTTFAHVYLNNLFYIDFYSVERFGKTKLGQMLLYAKQSQNKKLIKDLVLSIKPHLRRLIKKYKINAIGFIPPTVKREVQLMKELERNLLFNMPKVSIIKVKTDVSVPQKTLNKLENRIENAQKTIVVNEKNTYNNILLVDDAVGSGATMNETAKKIKNVGVCSGKIIGLAITGSFKGFDVISEV